MNPITIFSTKAEDILVDQKRNSISRQEGGSLLFIENALKDLKIRHESFYGDTISVEILITDNGEFGKIPQKLKIRTIPKDFQSGMVIVSTILNEWDLKNITSYKGKVFIDIQGYVRDGSDFGKKKFWKDSIKFYQNIECFKATAEEIRYVPEEVIKNQRKKLLVITHGAKGVELWSQEKCIFLPVIKEVKAKNTIGAGDTFFGYFVGFLYLDESIEVAAKKAIDKTCFFLLSKS